MVYGEMTERLIFKMRMRMGQQRLNKGESGKRPNVGLMAGVEGENPSLIYLSD